MSSDALAELAQMAEMYRKRGKLRRAANIYSQIVRLSQRDSSIPASEVAIVLYKLADIYDELGQNDSAVRLYREAIEKYNRGEISERLNLLWYLEALKRLETEADAR